MYTITVKIAASGTAYTDPEDLHNSLTGHMWYSLAEDGVSTGSFGFAPVITEMDGPGKVYRTDDEFYAGTYYTGTIVIEKEQYDRLRNFGDKDNLNGNPFDFSTYYNGLTNSCVDYVWKALNIIGMNPSDFEGQNIPTSNADNVDGSLYNYLFGNTSGWSSSDASKGNYDAIYGSNNDDILRGDSKTDAIYGGGGKDDIYGGSLAEKLYGGEGDDFIDGSLGNDTIEGAEGNDTLDGGDGTDTLLGGTGDDNLFGDAGDDTLNGGEDNDTLNGGSGLDTLLGESGNDTLIGGGGNDTLDGGEGSDTLMGGDDYDTYLAGNGDTISDSDGSGRVNFEGNMLSGGTFNKDTGVYEGDGGSYSLSGGTLTFTNGAGTITIDNYSKDADSLGIHLEDKDDEDEENPNTNNILPETSAGEGHNENFSSPLVLDLNGNGTTSTFIAQTNTYFDMDGDGFKERISWTESSDGLLTLDLNNDGKVTNGGELFGNNTKLANGVNAKDGFEALSQYDLNKDNVIDAKDSIYSHLKVWIDSNSDGISTTDELKTLQELNITSINLNATETSTSEAYNTISDTSTFTQDGQTKTINDVWFYQNKSDTTYDYTTPIKESVAALPTIEGSGRVKDLQDAMNNDTVLEAKVTNLLNNASTMSFSNFSSAFNFFTCKIFSIQKALHVKIQIQHKGA
ncbi:calcium-binding protein [Sulfurospirillum deleyianum]|uniref:Hemolysin-type calcium-binding region n=1 Tax=Sulfurospirillum deleyianum (strain ATCC 51133 / DSM 6946 / 5175) TaxID=525898 RepID=D1B1Q0_SULD5|nr:calcium-binding protein [Sulfurospirillum deleyianum]ACZ12020.1 hypothetical protein Sdel_0991 [Sulfurospirillum deleyianum DSM 6946]